MANIAFYYFLSIYTFYKPTIIAGFRHAPLFRIAYFLAKDLCIPYFCVEWGVLGGTYAYDIYGSMGESYVTLKHKEFNSLEDL